ncbi:TauD/TfdA family dioxygenase [Aquincola sp. J276]|uniref:TauD/TfdA dioxygenase family protein n=1 Tax=Aquincola sp. J276 TaxID=2898432 RepID=UPI00215076BD|nr:TauD/TfdA family dioxygenase [Aquincola sp. J276]MCR5867300.1 TauD/TfdA family dioxygenase [Aquincola sp. J276]
MLQATSSTLQLENLSPFIGTAVHGIDLREPVSDADFAVLRDALNQRSLLLFRGQQIDEGQHVAFSRRFGTLLGHVLTQFLKQQHPEIYVLSNVTEGGKPIGNHKEGWNWHSDLSYKAEPSLGALLYAVEVPPEGGDTLFASMHAAWDALDPAMQQRIRHLKATHSYANYYGKAFADRQPLSDKQRADVPDVQHPLVRTHPETGRLSLYVGQDVVKQIDGLPAEESTALLAELNAHAIDPRFSYRHRWQAGDLLIWDNRSTMHCATPYDDHKYRRVMHRTTVAGDRPF